MSAQELVVQLSAPPRVLSPNASGRGGSHWAHTKARKAYRQEAWLAATQALQQARLGRPRWPAATVEIRWHRKLPFPDPDNTTATFKAAFDGLVDAGVIADDNRLQHLPPLFTVDDRRRHGRRSCPVVIAVKPIQADRDREESGLLLHETGNPVKG